MLSHPFLDLEAARERWSSTQSQDRLATLTGAQNVIDVCLGDIAENKLLETELKVCSEIVKTINKVAPAAVSSAAPPTVASNEVAIGGSTRRSSRSGSTPLGSRRGASPSIGRTGDPRLSGGGARTAVALFGATAGTRKILPRGLKDQILGSTEVGEALMSRDENEENVGPFTRHKLQKVEQSKANKWIKAYNSPEKNDMRSILDKKFGQLRKFLGNEDDDNDDDSTAWNEAGATDEFTFHN